MNEFDVEAPEQQMESLRGLITSPAWQGFFIPQIQQARNNAIALLVRPTDERRAAMSDDFLRARITVLEELLNLGPAAILEWSQNSDLENRQQEYEQSLGDRAELGHVGPLPQ